MNTTTTKQFHLLAVMTALTGVVYEEKPKTGFSAMAEVFYHIYDPYIMPNGMAVCQTHCHDEILRQHPELIELLWEPDMKPIEYADMLKKIYIYASKNGSYVSLEGPYHATEFAKKLREQEGIPEVTQ